MQKVAPAVMLAPQFLHFMPIGNIVELESLDIGAPNGVGRVAEAMKGPLPKKALT